MCYYSGLSIQVLGPSNPRQDIAEKSMYCSVLLAVSHDELGEPFTDFTEYPGTSHLIGSPDVLKV